MTLITDCIKNTVLSLRAIGASVLVAGLVACGGGGGGGGAAAPAPAPPASTTTYLHYMSGSTAPSAAGSLTTIDPAAPAITANTNPALVNSTPGRLRVSYVSTGTFASGTVSDLHRYAVLFVSGGVIKKQSAVVSTPVPAVVQISSASGITDGPGDGSGSAGTADLCFLGPYNNLQDPDSSIVIYSLAGDDKQCYTRDDAYSRLRLNTPATIPPTPIVEFTGLPIPTYNNTGAITGYLALNTLGALIKLDSNFSNLGDVTDGTGPFSILQWLIINPESGQMLLLAGNSIRTYDLASNTLGAALGTINQPDRFVNYTYDATNFYFVDNPLPSYSTNVIQRLSLTTGVTTTVVTETAGALINDLASNSTPSRLVYSMTSGAMKSIQSIVRTATNATSSTPLYPATATTNSLEVIGSTTTGRVYINHQTATGIVTAVATNDNATSLMTYADAKWNAVFADTTVNASVEYTPQSQVILLQRNGVDKTTDDDATLTAYDAAAHTIGATLGTVPTNIASMSVSHELNGPRTLMTGVRNDSGTDIFYVDVLSARSLTWVTNDTAVEQVLRLNTE